MRYKCLTIAGSDPMGGAGIQADIKTFSALGSYAMSVITVIASQNTLGVKDVHCIPVKCIELQLKLLFEDIKIDAIKIGMLYTNEIIELVSTMLNKYAKDIPIVLDPVMCCSTGSVLLSDDALHSLKTKISPISDIITPNLYEASVMTGIDFKDMRYDNMEYVAMKVLEVSKSKSIILKGGHFFEDDTSNDLFIDPNNNDKHIIESKRISSKNTHGTGCTLAAGICAYLSQGETLKDSCIKSKEYVTNAIKHSADIVMGKGHGSLNHFYNIYKK